MLQKNEKDAMSGVIRQLIKSIFPTFDTKYETRVNAPLHWIIFHEVTISREIEREKSKFLFDIIGYIRKEREGFSSNSNVPRVNVKDECGGCAWYRGKREKIDLFRREKRRDTKRHYGSLSQCRINTPICRG